MNIATEGNGLMASLLNAGELPFLGVKLAVGAFTAYILYRCAHLQLARTGMRFVLAVYLLLLVVHTATGFAALGWQAPATVFSYLANLPGNLLAYFSYSKTFTVITQGPGLYQPSLTGACSGVQMGLNYGCCGPGNALKCATALAFRAYKGTL